MDGDLQVATTTDTQAVADAAALAAGGGVTSQELAELGGGLVGGIAGAKTANAAQWLRLRISAPLADTVTRPRGTVPAESASPAELKAYADENGIPLTAQETEHNLPRNLQSAGERATAGGTAIRQQIRASQAAIAEHTDKLMDSFSPNTADLATAGSKIKASVSEALDRQLAASRQDYAAIDKQAQGVQVNLQPLKQAAQQILSDTNFVRKVGALDPKRATAILQDMANLPDHGSFSQAQQLLSALLDASRTPELAINTLAQAWIKQMTGTVDTEMMTAAQSKPGLEVSFRAANGHWTQLHEDFNNPRSPLAQILAEPDPSKVPQKVMQRGQIGGSPYNAYLFHRYGIDKGPVKWAVTGDLLQKNFSLYNGGKTLAGYSDDFLKSLFRQPELDAIYRTGAIARSVGLNTNPSGTAAVTGAMEDVRKPLGSLLPKALAAKATKSPGVNAWMMRPGTPVRNQLPPGLARLIAAAAPWRKGDEQ